MLRNPLTNEQAEAVATDEDATLVLAGAGTGKTSVIVGKVAHLIRNQDVSPDEVLVLAFNRKAADEIRGRLKGDLSAAHVHTFHSFGRRVIAESESAPTISKLAEDDLALKRAVDTIIGELLNDPEQSKAVIDFIVYHHAPYKSAFEFDTLDEYEEYVREIELRTLSGVLVKSFEELEIANYLTEHGVEFRYEDPYETATTTQRHRQYQPDFFLPGHGIYIEHFALDRNGRPPPGWRGYAEGVEWKRTIHRQRGSTLVETYSWQHRQGVLLETLRRRLEEAGVRFEQIPRQELVRQLAQEQTSWLAGLLATFLNHVKSSRLSSDELGSRARQTGDRRRNESFLDVFEQVRVCYQKLLTDQEALDFHDLINLAAEHIRAGRWKPRYRYVLVDEFQDISAGRMALLQALRDQDVAYFLVGDDWQSIYRFAGSDIGLLRDCDDLLGHVEERTLSRTFRFDDGILSPSTAFVKRNPEQTQRPLLPAGEAEDEGVAVVADPSPAGGVARALQDIEAKARGQQTVLVLGRYRPRRRRASQVSTEGIAKSGVQHRSWGEGPRGRLRDRARPQRRSLGVPFQGRGRSPAGPRAAPCLRGSVPVCGGTASLLRGDDPGTEWRIPGDESCAAIDVCDGAAERVRRVAAHRRTSAGVPKLSQGSPTRLTEPNVYHLLRLKLRPPCTPLSELRCGLRIGRGEGRLVYKSRLSSSSLSLSQVRLGRPTCDRR